MTAPRHELAAAVIRRQIEDGTMEPGQPVPSAAALAARAGASAEAFLGAFRLLLRAGVLVPGPSRLARPHVAG